MPKRHKTNKKKKKRLDRTTDSPAGHAEVSLNR